MCMCVARLTIVCWSSPLCSSGSRKSCRPLGRLRTTSQEYPSSGRRKGSWRSGSSCSWTSLPSLLASSSAVFSATATTWSISSCKHIGQESNTVMGSEVKYNYSSESYNSQFVQSANAYTTLIKRGGNALVENHFQTPHAFLMKSTNALFRLHVHLMMPSPLTFARALFHPAENWIFQQDATTAETSTRQLGGCPKT